MKKKFKLEIEGFYNFKFSSSRVFIDEGLNPENPKVYTS